MKDEELCQLTQGELEVMDILWSNDRDLSRTEVLPLVEARYHRNWKIQTVSTYLAHLVEKGFIEYYRKGVYFYYHVLVPQEVYKKRETRRFLDFWYDNSVDELILGLVDQSKISKETVQKLEDLINELDH